MGTVILDPRDETTWITFDTPKRRNAFDPDMAATAVEVLEATTDVRAVVITGAPGAFARAARSTCSARPR
jgi:enoyl-CoA hydratase/carnithine racemase